MTGRLDLNGSTVGVLVDLSFTLLKYRQRRGLPRPSYTRGECSLVSVSLITN